MKVFLICLIVLIGWTTLLHIAEKRRKVEIILRFVSILLVVVALYGVFDHSVLKRSPSDDHQFVWVSAYNSEFSRELFMNGLLYYPLGLTLTVLIGPWAILAGFLLSLSIESWQYFAGTGLAQGTDVIMNTLGCTIGFLPWFIAKEWTRIKRWLCIHYRHMKERMHRM